MSCSRTLLCLVLIAALAPAGAALAQRLAAAPGAVDSNTLQGGGMATTAPPLASEEPPRSGRPQPGGAREARGNPLWAVPLRSLSATRERPLFLPSRRQPAPAVAGPPPPAPVQGDPSPPAAPERPALVLVGTIVGDSESIAIFYDEGTREAIRLKTGESHDGWVLASVRGREATLEKGGQTVLLALPEPGATTARRNQEL